MAFFISSTVSRILYIKESAFDTEHVNDFLRANCPGAVWKALEKDNSDGSYGWFATMDGVPAYGAKLKDNGTILSIWTKEDNDLAAALGTQEARGL